MKTQLNQLINKALDKLYKEDKYLIDKHLHEQCIVFRFALYFYNMIQESEFKDYDLDIEYNRNGNKTKCITNYENGVRPDLILHKRGNDNNNLLVLEFKKGESDIITINDKSKIKEFINPNMNYRYKNGAIVLITPNRSNRNLEWID